MTFDEFKSSLEDDLPPSGISTLLTALWYDGKGDWEASHNIAQDVHTDDGSWVHAYLHRKEDDPWNAKYWYRRAGKKMPEYGLKKEWEEMVRCFINGDLSG